MIHCISTLTFKFHLLLTIETQSSTITWVREFNMQHGIIMATAWAPTTNKSKTPMCAIVIFPEALSAQWETLLEFPQEGFPLVQPAAYLKSKYLRVPLPMTGSADFLCGSSRPKSADIICCWCKMFRKSSNICNFQELWKSKICFIAITPTSKRLPPCVMTT